MKMHTPERKRARSRATSDDGPTIGVKLDDADILRGLGFSASSSGNAAAHESVRSTGGKYQAACTLPDSTECSE